MEEHKPSEVIFKYYMPEHEHEVYLHTSASKMHCILWDIDQLCRSAIKYDDNCSDDKVRLAEEIREMICSIDFDSM
jgi:hypothetical protein